MYISRVRIADFFLKSSPRQFYPINARSDISEPLYAGSGIYGSTSDIAYAGSTPAVFSRVSSDSNVSSGDTILSIDKFTVFQTSEPVSVRASYGPFSTKQTVPAKYIVPDLIDSLQAAPNVDPRTKNDNFTNGNTLLESQGIGTRHLDMSAHVVTTNIPRDSPVLRVLFHAGSEATGHRQLLQDRLQRVCVLLHASLSGAHSPVLQSSLGPQAASSTSNSHNSNGGSFSPKTRSTLSAVCSPDGQDGVCMAQITIPAAWWTSLPPPDSARRIKPTKTVPRMVQLSYTVLEPKSSGVDNIGASPSQETTMTELPPTSQEEGVSNTFCQPRVQIQPATPLGQVTLTPNRAAYKELKADEYLTLLVPHGQLFPKSRLHVPVFLRSHSSKETEQKTPPVATVILRAKVKSGMKILDAASSSPDWIIETNISHKNTAIFTARRKENISRLPNASAEEIMTMLLEASEENSESRELGGRIVWSVRYALEGEEDIIPLSESLQMNHPQQEQSQKLDDHHHAGILDRKKLQVHLEIQKDDIQAVLPISKNWEVINTAVLTGRQMSQAMKVFIISQAGTVADVTLQSSCHSEDESVLKVSSSCSSVYVDGSEIRGSSNASVLVKFGTYTGLAKFIVWMPEFPLEVSLTDTRLSQIKGWKIPVGAYTSSSKIKRSSTSGESATATLHSKFPTSAKQFHQTELKPSNVEKNEEDIDVEQEMIGEAEEDEDEGDDTLSGAEDDEHSASHGIDPLSSNKLHFRGEKWDDQLNFVDKSSIGISRDLKSSCRLKFQQAVVEVYARFSAADHDSGRVSYFVNRRTWLRITDLVGGLLRISDPRIAILLRGKIVLGRALGRAEVQVISPASGRVIGAREIRVGNDRVAISQLSVKVVSGLQLTITSDTTVENGYVAETAVTRKLTAQYQEGLLDIDIKFSDGTKTPLRDIEMKDYHILVESLDPEVVAFAPMAASPHPRVIAVGEGQGDLLKIALQVTVGCQMGTRKFESSSGRVPPVVPLASTLASVEVDFASSDLPTRPEFIQNDGGGNFGLASHHRDRSRRKELITDLHDILLGGISGVGVRHTAVPRMTALEIGMYILLVAFCFVILVFIISCVVYTNKFKPQSESTLANLPVFGAARDAARQFVISRRPRESTQDAHDWVWLGRATLQRSVCNNNVNGLAQQHLRLITNPLEEPEGELINVSTSSDKPNHMELPTFTRSRHIDTTTYCKRSKSLRIVANNVSCMKLDNSSSYHCDDENNVPSPLTLHKASLIASSTSSSRHRPDGKQLGKSSIPIHRIKGKVSTQHAELPRPRRHRQPPSSGSAEPRSNDIKNVPEQNLCIHEGSSGSQFKDNTDKNTPISTIQEPPAPCNETYNNPVARDVKYNDQKKEVKRDMVVGKPMILPNLESPSLTTSSCWSHQGFEERSLLLEDLHLGMDYNQIMQYFNNLKESNA